MKLTLMVVLFIINRYAPASPFCCITNQPQLPMLQCSHTLFSAPVTFLFELFSSLVCLIVPSCVKEMAIYLYKKWKATRETPSTPSGPSIETSKPSRLCKHRTDSLDFTSEQESAILLESQARNSEGREGGTSEPPAGISYAEPCNHCIQEKKASRRYRWRLTAGLMLPYMVQALDITIIAGALPFIASDFSESQAVRLFHQF